MAYHEDWRVVGVDTTLADDFYEEAERLFDLGLLMLSLSLWDSSPATAMTG